MALATLGRAACIAKYSAALSAVLLAAGCATVNKPMNAFSADTVNAANAVAGVAPLEEGDGTYVGLAFSGGGTRAAAFAHGMLLELSQTTLPGENGANALSSLRFVSGVSGGSVTAAWYGLKGEAGLMDFRDRFLIRDAEAYMRKSTLNPVNIARVFTGGVNGQDGFTRWLDQNLFGGARFADMRRDPRLTVWINASDIYNQTPFIFDRETFRALCSDLDSLPVAEAVAASAAVPVIFAPVVLEAYGPRCDFEEPAWMTTAAFNPEATASLRAYARALRSYRDPEKLKYVKLLDGGLTDNFGVTSLAIARAASQTGYGPLSAEEAVRMKRLLFLVGNAGRQLEGDWGRKLSGPGGASFVMAIADTATAAATRHGYDAFRTGVARWHEDLVAYRCSLSPAEVRRLRGTTNGWDCKDLKLFVGEIRFDQLDEAMQAKLNKVATRLVLPTGDVDLTIEAGREALRRSPEFNGFLRSLEGFSTEGKTLLSAAPAGATLIQPTIE